MSHRRNQTSVEQATCRRYNLLTPAWRTECIHCELPVESLLESLKELRPNSYMATFSLSGSEKELSIGSN